MGDMGKKNTNINIIKRKTNVIKYGKSTKKGKLSRLFILFLILLTLIVICDTVSADPYLGGNNLTTIQNGTVSGGLYSDSYYGCNGPAVEGSSNQQTNVNVTYQFEELPQNAQVVNATLYVVVYSGNMETDYPTDVNVTFNGELISTEHLSSTYTWPKGSNNYQALVINDHVNRVTSDYLMWYDVTSLVGLNNIANVVSDPNCFDGRIKLITLIIAYDDGDDDTIQYWVNLGHDPDSYWVEQELGYNYIGNTSFESALPTGSIINNAKLRVFHMASQDGSYKFNGNVIPNGSPQGSFSGSNNWDVTNNFTSFGTNTMTYDRVGGYYKIVLALLTVNYTVPDDKNSDLFVSNIVTTNKPVINNDYNLTVTINNGGQSSADNFVVKVYDNGQEMDSKTINTLNASSSRILTFSWTPTTTGLHNLQVVIDALEQVVETNETNNQLTQALYVEPERPDLIPEGLTIPSNPIVNHNYSLIATISNQGLTNAESFQVKLYDGSTLLGTQNISSLVKGGNINIQFNWKPTTTGSHTLKLVVDTLDQVNESNEINNQLNRYVIMNDAGIINVFIISDSPGTNIANLAAHELLNQMGGTLSIQIRSGFQVEAMSEDELRAYISSCDIFLGEWITTNAATLLSSALQNHPEIANKPNGLFLILEPPVSTSSSIVELMKYSNIMGVKLLETFTTNQLLDYYENTKRGGNYTNVTDYLATVNFPTNYNIATLYKVLNDKDSTKNQILWALNLIGVETQFELPAYSSSKQQFGIYRYRWYTLEEYMAVYFKSNRQGTVGLIESTMYVDSQMLQTYYAIIESLEAQGLNVIPVTAYGGTTAQLQVMVQAFTNATSYQNFITNPTAYATYVDSIVEMAAYGLGGESFTNVVNFLSTLNVPVVRAIHSDVINNEQWELESSGLPTDDGSKWWHIAILEAQGIIEYTFVGGKSTTIDAQTGAAIVGYDPQAENIEYMAKRVASWVKLQYMDNADKIIAMIYYNYPPGKDNIGSSYLDTITSIYNLLNVLKAEGYTVENIPANATDLEELMITLGINVANWAPGELQKLANNPNIILYPVSDYVEWFNQLDALTRLQVVEGPVAYIGELCKRSVELNYTSGMEFRIEAWYSGMLSLLPDDKYSVAKPVLENIVSSLKKYVTSHSTTDYNNFLIYKQQFLNLKINGTTGWGEAPGDIMVVQKNGIKYFVIPGLQFGNIFIGPEPQRGWEGDIAKLYHSSTVSPPHQYLAYFAYLQKKGTNAMVFMGRHATHEWLPGKELVLSPNDFPSVCVGNVPQIYFYITDGLAEGMQAKRRGYAVIISHLTPPMTFTSLYGDLGTLATLADQYDTATSAQQATIITQVKSIITNNHYDLGVDTSTLSNEGLIAALEAYLYDIQSTLYPYGLHAIGQAWTPDEIALLVTSILSVEFKVTNTTESTTLHNEISLLINGKSYDSLTAMAKENVQAKCIEVVNSLIYWDVDTVANILSSTPSANLKFALQMAEYYIWAVNQSVANEVSSLLKALNGGYIVPGAGGDPVGNPDVLPTGTNFFHDQAAEIPTKEAYEYSKILALLALADITDNTEKIALGIWCVETARDNGALVALVLQLLGMEPVWSDSPSAGVGGQKLKEMPAYLELTDLVRPDGWSKKRIDVTIITSGLFRDLYSRQAQLMDNAFRVALARSYYTIINNAQLKAMYGDKLKTALNTIMEGIGYYGAGYESLNNNYVAKHWVEDFQYYLTLNMTPEVAGEMAITRIFAPPEGDYGAGISKLVSESWTWKDRMELGQFYLNRMANMYSHKNWGTSNVAVFSRALSGIGTVFTSRNTNLYGVLDNDDFFDYWGGLSMALEYVNGKAPDMYVLDYSNRAKPDSISLEQYMNRELTTRYFNPGWIQGMMNEGYSGARYMSKKFTSNLLGWQMTRPGSVKNWMWDKVVDVYLRDSYNMGVTSFLKSGNNAYSMISLTGTLLTAAFEGYWTTDASSLNFVANTWAQTVIANGVACCDCSCGNIAMVEWAMNHVNADLLAHLKSVMYDATQQAAFAPGQTPASQPTGSTSTGAQSSDSQSSSQSQDSSASGSTVGGDESESTTTPGEEGEGKAYEVSKQSSGGSSESGLPIVAIVGVIALVCLVGLGYFRGNRKGK
jgi:cobaltochelatase CobN